MFSIRLCGIIRRKWVFTVEYSDQEAKSLDGAKEIRRRVYREGGGIMWRRLNFYDSNVLKRTDPAVAEITRRELTTAAEGGSILFFGDNSGRICMVNREYQIVGSFQAHSSRVTHLAYVKERNVLVSVGDGIDARTENAREESKRATELSNRAANQSKKNTMATPTVKTDDRPVVELPPRAEAKFWKVQKRRAMELELSASLRVFGKSEREEPITTVAVSPDLRMMAFGLSSGRVVLWRGGLMSFRPKMEVLRRGSDEADAVTGLAFVSATVSREAGDSHHHG
eukprot:g5542.t1